MRLFKNILLALLILLGISILGFTFWVRDHYVVPILMYHHVGVPSDTKWRLNTVSEKSFDYQLNFMKRHDFHVISFDDFITGTRLGQEFARNTVIIQFDDGYEDNYKYAFPILKKYGYPAIVFLTSDKIGDPGFLTWDQVKEMEKSGFMAGAHTRHHAYLPTVDPSKLEDEIAGSKKIIEDHLGHRIDYFAYPIGGFTTAVKDIVRQSGYKAAVTTNRGKHRLNGDLYELKRIHMNNSDDQFSGIVLWFKLSGYYNLFRKQKDGSSLKDYKGKYEQDILFK
jgi:peptidoglycan/xylan/chitin deacetylase (PgdA/CDA1 family)